MKLNKKGYMLVEIILASVIAFGVGYFILQMVINLKNKNNDLLVETLTVTDQAIIMNKLMEYAKSEEITFSCDNLTKDGKVIKYGDEVIVIVNDYADVGEISCDYTDGLLKISVPLEVKQLSNKNFNVKLDYKPSDGTISQECYKEFDDCPNGWSIESGQCFKEGGCSSVAYGCNCYDASGNRTFNSSAMSSASGCTSMVNGATFFTCTPYYIGCTKCHSGYSMYRNTCGLWDSYSECSGEGWIKKDNRCYNTNCGN